MTATYARCTEPTGSNAREGCGWTGEVERVDEMCPECNGEGSHVCDVARCPFHSTSDERIPCDNCDATGKVTHDGEGRWPFDINACPQCGGTIEVDK